MRRGDAQLLQSAETPKIRISQMCLLPAHRADRLSASGSLLFAVVAALRLQRRRRPDEQLRASLSSIPSNILP